MRLLIVAAALAVGAAAGLGAGQFRPPKLPDVPPFIIDDVNPPIVITQPDTLERMIVISDFVASGQAGKWDTQNSLPLLQAMCGDQFGRVWMLVKDDPDGYAMIELINAMWEHFASVVAELGEVAELPGGSEGSSN